MSVNINVCIYVFTCMHIYVCMYVRMCMYVWANMLMCYMKMMSVCMRPAVYNDGFVYKSVYPHGALAHDVWVRLQVGYLNHWIIPNHNLGNHIHHVIHTYIISYIHTSYHTYIISYIHVLMQKNFTSRERVWFRNASRHQSLLPINYVCMYVCMYLFMYVWYVCMWLTSGWSGLFNAQDVLTTSDEPSKIQPNFILLSLKYLHTYIHTYIH